MSLLHKLKHIRRSLSDLIQKSLELDQTIKNLKDDVREKAKTVKVKDDACLNFKKKKEESENRLNKVLRE